MDFNVEKPPTTSLIIPYYNGKDFIDRCVESAIRQKEKYSEIIIVDDGSSNEHAEYLIKFLCYDGMRVLTKKNGGQGSARNYGAINAIGSYICFVDQDDYLLPEHNSILKSNLISNLDCGYVYGEAVKADIDGNIIGYNTIKNNSTHPKEHIFDFIKEDCFILPSSLMISKKVFLSVNGFDPQFTGYEDDDLVLRLWRAGYKGFFIDYPVYVWCIHSSSTSYSINMSISRYKYIVKLSEMFPVNSDFSIYVFRDLVFPRFYKTLLKDIKRYRSDSQHLSESLNIFRKFLAISKKNMVKNKNIFKLRIYSFFIVYFPEKITNFLFEIYKVIRK